MALVKRIQNRRTQPDNSGEAVENRGEIPERRPTEEVNEKVHFPEGLTGRISN